MITPELVKVYNWFDIQSEICTLMGIAEEYFRDYHKVVGGGYKDLWHVALDSIFPDTLRNDTIVTLYRIEESYVEILIAKHGEWTRAFFVAYNEVMDSLDQYINGIEVRFSW